MYKDKDKQREANRQAAKKYRDSMTGKGMTVSPEVIPSSDIRVIPKRGKDIKYFEDLHPEIRKTIELTSTDKDGKLDEDEKKRRIAIAVNYQHLYPDRYEPRSDLEFTTLMTQADPNTKIRVSKPGDDDYDGICTPEWIAERKACKVFDKKVEGVAWGVKGS